MLFIAHRINTVEELKSTPTNFGVEIDIRDRGERLILQHDPYKDGVDFEFWLESYNHKLLICNIKSEGVEYRVIELLKRKGIVDYFFLDSSLPMIMKLNKLGETKIAIRYSEVEPRELAMKFIGKCDWLWVDCFSHYPEIDDELKMYFKVCLVGPTLQLHDWKIEEEWKSYCAVCDKKYKYENWI